jgi:hypothetical protein
MMAGLQNLLNPNKEEDKSQAGLKAVIFANQRRSPASLSEDSSLSIFDRITYRYHYVGRRIFSETGALK